MESIFMVQIKNYLLILLIVLIVIPMASAITFTPNDKFLGTYHIDSVTGNESILYNVLLENNILSVLPIDKTGITKEECTTSITTGKETCKNVTYLVPNTLQFSTSDGTKIALPKITDKWIYTLPTIYYKWIKFGLESITLTGDTTYNSTNTNLTDEGGLVHMTITDQNLTLYYPFNINNSVVRDQNFILKDYSLYSADFTTMPMWSNLGPLGNSIIGNGTGTGIYAPMSASLNQTNSYTIMMWFNESGARAERFFERGRTAGSHVQEGYYCTATTTAKQITCGVTNSSKDMNTTTYSNAFTIGAWNMLTLVIDVPNNKSYIYINNTNVGNITHIGYTAATTASYNLFNLGMSYDGGSSLGTASFRGGMAEARVWNRTLTATEIANIYGNETTGVFDANMNRTSLVLEWNMTESGDTKYVKDTQNLNRGVALGWQTFNWTNNGKFGGAMGFNGFGDIINAPIAKLNTTWMSVSFWAKPYENVSQSNYVWTGNGLTNKMDVLWYPGSGTYKGYACILGNGSTANSLALSTITAWHHVACTGNATTTVLYIDGVQQSSISNGGLSYQTTTGMTIGGTTDTRTYYNGSIDSFKVWNRTLTATEINNDYLNQYALYNPTGLMLFNNTLNFGINNTVNITLSQCYQNSSTLLQVQIGNGTISNFSSSCSVLGYNITGNLTATNMTIYFSSNANNSYSPELIGNITLDDYYINGLGPLINYGPIYINVPNANKLPYVNIGETKQFT
jgi:hypothetical protein